MRGGGRPGGRRGALEARPRGVEVAARPRAQTVLKDGIRREGSTDSARAGSRDGKKSEFVPWVRMESRAAA